MNIKRSINGSTSGNALNITQGEATTIRVPRKIVKECKDAVNRLWEEYLFNCQENSDGYK